MKIVHPLRALLLTASIIPLLCACNTMAPSRQDASASYVPDAYASPSGTIPVPDRWWESFDSPELDKLVQRALDDNLSLVQAEARLRQSQATARRAGATLYPDLDASASAAANRRRAEVAQTDGTTGLSTTTSELYGLGLAASYEVDLWGRVRSTRDAAALAALASRQDLEATAMTLAGEITDLWLRQLEYRAQLRILETQRDSNKTVLSLIKLRQLKSLATALDVRQQEQVLASSESLIPLVQSQLDLVRHQLSVLVGSPPGTILDLPGRDLPAMPPLPDTGIPAAILSRRPDLQAAFIRLQAADRGVMAAEADRLPALRLTGRLAYESDTIDTLFDNWLINLVAGLTAPILDGGRRRAEVDRTQALADERLAAYRDTALNAIREVEDALTLERRQQEHLQALNRELNAARSALQEANRRYRKGIIDYLPVLQALTTQQRLEREVISAHRLLLSHRTQLYRALGGSWTRSLNLTPHREDNPS